MNEEENKNYALRQKVIRVTDEVVGIVGQRECFYEEDDLQALLNKLDDLKASSIAYYESNKRLG